MKKSTYTAGTKEFEKLRLENKKIKEEYEKYRESTSDKLKDLDNILSQNDKLKKENEDLKKKLSKINNINTTQIQNISQKPIDKLKIDLHNKEASISLIAKQKEFLLSIIIRLINLNMNSKINKELILSQIDEKNIDKEKEKEKLVKDIINTIQEGKKNLNIKNFEFNGLIKNNFSFEIVINKNNKINSSKNNRKNNSNNNNSNEKNNYKKEAELIRKLNEMLGIIKKKKELLKSKKNSLSFRVGTIKEGK